jgi:hypothetical protein
LIIFISGVPRIGHEELEGASGLSPAVDRYRIVGHWATSIRTAPARHKLPMLKDGRKERTEPVDRHRQ